MVDINLKHSYHGDYLSLQIQHDFLNAHTHFLFSLGLSLLYFVQAGLLD